MENISHGYQNVSKAVSPNLAPDVIRQQGINLLKQEISVCGKLILRGLEASNEPSACSILRKSMDFDA